jgi:ATP-binding cassette subfamily C protein
MNCILLKSSREINTEPQGHYLSILNNDITTLEQNYIQASILIIIQSIMCIAGIVVMIYLNWVMTLIVLGATLLPLVISSIFGVQLKKHQDTVSLQNSRYVGLIKDILGGNFVIKSFRVESQILKLNSETIDLMEGAKEKHRRVFSNMQVLVQSSTFLIVFLIFILGAYLVKKELFTIGGVMAFL